MATNEDKPWGTQQVPAQSAPAAAGTTGGTLAGRITRSLANRGVANAELAANAAIMPVRALGGFARDAYYGFTGGANPNQGRSVGSNFDFGRFGPGAPQDFSGVTGKVTSTARPTGGPDFSGVTSRVIPGTSAPGAATAGTPSTAAGGILRGRDANGNSVYSDTAGGLAEGTRLANAGFGTGGARRVPAGTLAQGGAGTAAAPASSGAAPSASPGAAGATGQPVTTGPYQAAAAGGVAAPQVQQQTVRGSQGAIIQNPNDTTADKLQRALTSSSLRGSPSARAAVAQAILGESSAGAAERAANLQAGRQADQAAIQANAVAPEGNAARSLQAQQINANLADRVAERQAEGARVSRTLVGSDGNTYGMDNTGNLRPVTGADGQPFRAQAPAITPKDQLDYLGTQRKAIAESIGMSADEKKAALEEIDGQASALMGGREVSHNAPSREQFLQQARKANPGASDADLIAYYNRTYGG